MSCYYGPNSKWFNEWRLWKVQRPESLVVSTWRITRVYTFHGAGSVNGAKRCGMELIMTSPSREITTVAHGFWRKAMPSEAKDYGTFEKQLLACYWVQVETALHCGIWRHQSSKKPIISWVLWASPSCTVGQIQQKLLVKWRYIQAEPEGMSKFQEQVTQKPNVTQQDFTSPCPCLTTWSHVQRVGSVWSAGKGEKVWAWFTYGLAQIVGENWK